MQPQSTIPNPSELIAIFIRRRWYFILPIILVLSIGTILSIKLPKKYSAMTTIMVQPQKLPEDYVRPVISEDLRIRSNAISEQIMSRTNLEQIIDKFKLYHGPNYERMFLEDKINHLRTSIKVDVTGGGDRNRDNITFRLTYTGNDPAVVRDVTNALANSFIEEDLKMREAYATGTSSFLEEELRVMESRLKEREASLRVYREKNRGGLPDQLQANLSQIERIQERLIEAQNNLYQSENQLMLLERQRSQAENTTELVPVNSENQNNQSNRPRINSRDLLEQLKAQYNDLSNRYTEHHPDVIRAKARIKDLEAKIAQTQTDSGNTAQSSGLTGQPAAHPARNLDQINVQQISDTQVRIRLLNNEISNLKGELAIYQKRVDETPRNEEALLSLQRDYDNINTLYNSLLNRKLEAEIAVNMEQKQKGEQFRVVDSAILPQKPSSPDMNKLFLMVFLAAFGGGGGLVFLLEYLDSSVRKPDQLEALTEIPVLASIPSIFYSSELNKKRFFNIAFIMTSIIALALTICFTSLSMLGINKSIELANKIISFT